MNAIIMLAAAAAAFSGSAALVASHHGDDGGALTGSCRVVIPATEGAWKRTLDPGPHPTEAKAAVAAINAAGSRLHVRLVAPGRPADVRITGDRDLPGNLIGQTRGCLGAGRAPLASQFTLDAKLPASVDRTEIVVRQLAVAIGLVRSTGPCSVLIHDQEAFKAACGSGYRRLSTSDVAAIRRIWGRP